MPAGGSLLIAERALRRHVLAWAAVPLVATGVIAAIYVLGFIVAGVLRLTYPYPLESLESASVQMVSRIAAGQPPYAAPTLEFIPLLYTPLYFYISGLVAVLTGPGLLPLRIVSLVASCVTCLLIYRMVERETESRFAGLVAAGLFAGSAGITNNALDVGRVDALAASWIVCAAYALRSADLRSRRSVALTAASGVFAALAIVTKQTHVIVAIALLVYAALTGPRRLTAYVLALGASLGLAALALTLTAGEWAWFFILELPRLHNVDEPALRGFWASAILPRFTLPLALGPVYFVACWLRRDYQALAFYGVLALGCLGLAWAGWANRGGFPNVLVPAFAVLAILFGLGSAAARSMLQSRTREAGALWHYWVVLCLLQLLIIGYNPRAAVPLRSEQWAGDRLSDTISTLPGQVFAPCCPEFSRLAGEGEQPNVIAIKEIVGAFGAPSRVREQWRNDLQEALSRRQYSYILWDPQEDEPFGVLSIIEGAGYVKVGSLFEPGDDFNLWKTRLTPDIDVYVPMERSSASGIPVPRGR